MTSPRSLKLLEIFGWYGAIAILSAYAFVSFKVIPADGWVYQLLNLIGVMIISFIKQARQPALLNLVWALVALIALIGLAIK